MALDFRDDFPSPTLAEWQAQVEKDLQTRRYEDLFWHTDEGFVVEPVATGEGIELPHMRKELAALLRPRRPWAVRERIAASDPARAGELARAALQGGAEQLLVSLDLLGQLGLDPLAPARTGDIAGQMAGSAGCAIYHQEGMQLVLKDVDLAKVPVAIEARSASLAVLAFLLHETRRRGMDPAELRVELGMDPLHEILFLEPTGSGPKHLLRECSDVLAFCADQAPGVHPIAIHSHEFHRCGANVVQELGCVLAAAIEYIRFLLAQGHPLDRILGGACVRVQVGSDLYLEIAKLRALRLLWAKVARAFGASTPEQLRVSVHAETSERERAVWRDTRGNLIRTAVQGFAAVVGGCDSLVVGPYDMNRTNARGTSLALARNQQLLLREEACLHRVTDPLAGASALESLTHQVAEAAWGFTHKIESRGGILETVASGWLTDEIGAAASKRADSFRSRSRVMVGVNRYVDPLLEAEEDETAQPPDDPSHAWLHEHLDEWKGQQDRSKVTRATRRLNGFSGPELVPAVAEAAAAGATIGELVAALRGGDIINIARNFNDYTGTDGLEFESLRNPTTEVPVLLVATGNKRQALGRARFAVDVFTVGGFRVIDVGYHHLAKTALAALRQHDQILTVRVIDDNDDGSSFQVKTRLVCLCADDEAYPEALETLAPQLRDRETRFFVVGSPRPGLDKHLDSFIYQGMDVAEFLEDLLQEVYRTPWTRWNALRPRHQGGSP